jgi:hypothetical protein
VLESSVTALSGHNTLYIFSPTICFKTRSFFMSYSTDSYVQEDTCTFSTYQRLRKINPYAYYSLDAQKQMQQDLREAGSLVFFEQDEDTLSEPDEAVGLISLPDALSEADQMIETGDADFHNKTETVLGRVMPKSW